MALIDCPSCNARVSSVASQCPECGFDLAMGMADEETLRTLRNRRYRDRMYVLKMLSFAAMAIAMIGAIPMLFHYISAIEAGTPAQLMDHWGVYLVGIGFVFYLVVRVRMLSLKSAHRRGQ